MSKPALNLLIGCDPEVFMTNPNDGSFVSAHGMIRGTKYEPFKVRNGAVQVDGNALEFNTDPADTAEKFVGNVLDVFEQMKAMVPGYNVVIEPVAVFDQKYFDSLPEIAKELGCDPDFDAYTGEMNPKPAAHSTMRAAGGHIHIGWTKDVDPFDPNHFADCRAVVKQLDHFLGTYSLCWDKDSTRRGMYGRAGAFRPKTYGVEYRTLSNRWLQSPEMIRWIFDTTRLAVGTLYSGKYIAEDDINHNSWPVRIVNNNVYNWNKEYGEYLPTLVAGFSRPPVCSWDAGSKKKIEKLK